MKNEIYSIHSDKLFMLKCPYCLMSGHSMVKKDKTQYFTCLFCKKQWVIIHNKIIKE